MINIAYHLYPVCYAALHSLSVGAPTSYPVPAPAVSPQVHVQVNGLDEWPDGQSDQAD